MFNKKLVLRKETENLLSPFCLMLKQNRMQCFKVLVIFQFTMKKSATHKCLGYISTSHKKHKRKQLEKHFSFLERFIHYTLCRDTGDYSAQV